MGGGGGGPVGVVDAAAAGRPAVRRRRWPRRCPLVTTRGAAVATHLEVRGGERLPPLRWRCRAGGRRRRDRAAPSPPWRVI